MRRLQLLGKSKNFLKNSTKYRDLSQTEPPEEQRCFEDHTDTNVDSNLKLVDVSGLLSLPEKILLMILEDLDNKTLTTLCLVNSFLYRIISDNCLYKVVKLTSKLSLLRFNALIHSEFHTINSISSVTSGSQNARFLTQTIDFINPQCQDSLLKYSKYHSKKGADHSVIGGSYSYTANPITSSPKVRSTNTDNKKSVINNSHDTSQYTNERLSTHSPFLSNDSTKLNKRTLEFLETLNKLEYKYSHYTYIELMLDIIDYLPNLSHIILSKVEPSFKIPLWYSAFNDGSKDFFRKIIKGQQSLNNNDLRSFQISPEFLNDYERKFYSLQRFKTLEIQAISDSTKRNVPIVPLRFNMLCCFGIINELILDNVIIDTESLDTPMEFLPLYIRKEQKSSSQKDIYDLHSTYNTLTLRKCHIVPGNGILRLFHSYFQSVTNVSLLSLTSKFDLLLCNCFPALKDLTIDCNSRCFTHTSLVNDDYYYKEINDQAFDEDDTASVAETLLDKPVRHILQVPPPTTAVVLSLNLNYISRTTIDKSSAMTAKKPSMITQSQSEFFHMTRIPSFHYCYHYFKKLFERIPSRNVNINVINIPFTNVFPLSPLDYWEKVLNKILSNDQETLIAYHQNDIHEDELHNTNNESLPNTNYQWDESVVSCLKECLIQLKKKPEHTDLDMESFIDNLDIDNIFNNFQNYQNFMDIPNINLYCFLKQLSKFKSVKIQLLRKWLFCTPRTRYDWELLLKPVLNVRVPIEVRERDGYVLYSYGLSTIEQRKKSNSNIVTPSRI
ncbi:similar to Saccharomyces cerevisiae YNL311C SKP2 F-box protein of unknown function predicted to be part of an SCF ubiquitin protease complex [Maudiozyma barnettii]|uniref:F-box domain-containing protein n=1 Tax=Maudiozyma barnettii TaxID=61262 RepID=A0A8H2ZFL9_9SACH|nr:putative SCF ubiquitin ligase complex subunit SKP2 [Kazachstania barnettii]CAB4253526.1 similar to Saccharomyces cerevisiae YNL311C SKP2 F-box protein of unknown function predicted to be part of an SCF ubiquitin protease complex [Kazachstania barnettii]CAD1781200.1 similar to Saccharomyces cerevisiae YNL311C SKP2 F-box protein of unknown function predicted to be part of an SCF ubiquitin protease complex [Kazachstania barnettii]